MALNQFFLRYSLKNLQDEFLFLKAENNKIQKELNRVQVLNNSSFEGIFIHDKGVLIDFNDEFLNFFGYLRDELLGKNMIKILFPSKYFSMLKKQMKLNYNEPIELEGKKKDGTIFDIEIEGREIELNDKIIGSVAIRKIAKRKKVEQSFIKEKYFSDNLLNSLPGIFYMYKLIDHKFRLIRWNKNHEIFTGYSSKELSKKLISDFFEEKEFLKIQIEIDKVFINGIGKIEGNLKLKNSTTVPYLFEGHAFTDNGKDYFMGVGLDVSHQKSLEKKY